MGREQLGRKQDGRMRTTSSKYDPMAIDLMNGVVHLASEWCWKSKGLVAKPLPMNREERCAHLGKMMAMMEDRSVLPKKDRALYIRRFRTCFLVGMAAAYLAELGIGWRSAVRVVDNALIDARIVKAAQGLAKHGVKNVHRK